MKRLRKFGSLPPADRRLLIESALLLVAIRLGLWLLPFQTLRRLLAKVTQSPLELRAADQGFIDRVAWAVAVTSRYMPGAPSCLPRALMAQALLARRGYPACLRIGVARSKGRQLQAHAWVEIQGRMVIGGLDDLLLYTPLLAVKERPPSIAR